MSCLLYLIYSLDISNVTHINTHKHNINEYRCGAPKIEIYIDDAYATISSNPNNIWKEIENYIKKMNQYYTNNLLINNLDKTKIMLITNSKDAKDKSIKLENKNITHSKTIKILGTTFNESLNWDNHLEVGNKSLITQLKQRRHAIYRLAKYVSHDFLLKYSNAILISKLNYHLEAWGTCRKAIKTQIDNILIGVAIKISNYNTIGRTNDYILKKLKWINLEERYQLTVRKLVHKLLNNDNNNRHFLAELITDRRTLRMEKENKLGPKIKINKKDPYSMKTFSFRSIDIYNQINRKFTLLINNIKFKICLNKLSSNPKTTFKITNQADYDIKCISDYKSDVFHPCSTPLF